MSKHTNGPWLISWGRGGTYPLGIHNRAQNIVTAIARPASEEAAANARLIAAAPELLEALQAGPGMLHTMPDGRPCRCSQCGFVRLRAAAIAKATGEQA